MTKRMPNFFIIGAPKCGTTSLAAWLAEHPNIYIPPVKEPHFFNTDLHYNNVQSRSQYEGLFRGSTKEHKAVGEASVFYLYSKVAVPLIEQGLPGSRYIVMIRNPVEMAYSLYEQQMFSGNEHITDFGKAWGLSEERARGRHVKRRCREPALLAYSRVCRLGEQLARLFERVPRERVLVLLLSDVKKNPRAEYLRILSLLNVADDGRTDFPARNSAKERRWPYIHHAVNLAHTLKRQLGLPSYGSRLSKAIEAANTRTRSRVPLSLEIEKNMISYFRDDVELLEELLMHNLSSWKVSSFRKDRVPISSGLDQETNISAPKMGQENG